MSSLDDLIAAVQKSAKYQFVSHELIRHIGERELAARRNLKEAVKATKNKLHQVGGAYFEAKIEYAAALAQLGEAAADPHAFRAACRDLMRRHASTRERLDILDTFYAATLAGLPDVSVVMDVACGLNPLAWPWMPLDENMTYIAYDIYADMIGFIGEFMELAGINGRARVRDVISRPPTEAADLVLLLKTLPVLAQVEKTAVPRLLDALNARYLLISFPAHSLGGRSKGMVQNYEAQFRSWVEGRPWQVQRFEFPTELAFLVTQNP